jgi:mRNA-degrading endonuclease RelE of RelBE toxin-antitoxin system
MYKILVSRKVLKSISKMPESIQLKLANLVEDLRDKGPLQQQWPNFSRIGKNEYHCHLSRKWVVCWYWEKGTIEIEVYYAGSRENAPY